MNKSAELEALLNDLIAHHEQMLSLCLAHADALARADGVATRRLIEEQQAVGRRIIDLDSRRIRLVAASVPGSHPPGGVTLSHLAARLPEPSRGRVLQLATRLRGVLSALVEQQRVVTRASESLLGHMQGLMAQVARKLSHSGTYGRPGAAPAMAGGPVVSGLDVCS